MPISVFRFLAVTDNATNVGVRGSVWTDVSFLLGTVHGSARPTLTPAPLRLHDCSFTVGLEIEKSESPNFVPPFKNYFWLFLFSPWILGLSVDFRKKGSWDFDSNSIDSVDEFGEHYHIKSSDLWTWMPFHLFRFSCSFSLGVRIFSLQVFDIFILPHVCTCLNKRQNSNSISCFYSYS